MKAIDLRSDTKTLPTPEMRQAIFEAPLGDDVDQEDPTINQLEELAAGMLGKEAAILTPSGIMSNLLAVLCHTRPGQEIIVGSQAHIFWYEGGGASVLGGVVMRTVPNEIDGRMQPELIADAIRPEDLDFPVSSLLTLENTHNRCGGAVLDAAYTAEACALAHSHGMKVHIDGARIFSAAVALNIPVKDLATPADSVCFCMSKNLSAPVGSVLCGNRDFIKRTRKVRRMLGGGMRQAGIIAAAGIVALETMVDRLAEDHANARRLAYGLSEIPGIEIQPERFKTNIVVFEPPRSIPVEQFCEKLARKGVLMYPFGKYTVRAVTHRMVSTADIDEALEQIKAVVKD